jgi:hypothetical protein
MTDRFALKELGRLRADGGTSLAEGLPPRSI